MIEQYSRQAGFLLEEGATPAAGRQGDGEVRHGDGPVPHGRPRRQRRRLVHPQAPLRREARHPLLARPPTCCASWAASARRPAPAGTTTSRASATRSRARSSTDMIEKHRAELGITPRKIGDEEIVQRLRLRAGQRRREDPRRGHRACAPATSTWSTSPATASRCYRGGPMHYADTRASSTSSQAMKRFAANPHDDAGVLGAGAAARQARRRRQDLQLNTASRIDPGASP